MSDRELIRREFGSKYADWEFALENLIRLRLIRIPAKESPHIPLELTRMSLTGHGFGGGTATSMSSVEERERSEQMRALGRYLQEDQRNTETAERRIQITTLGLGLVQACSEPAESLVN